MKRRPAAYCARGAGLAHLTRSLYLVAHEEKHTEPVAALRTGVTAVTSVAIALLQQ
ncbi:MAG TPA: hypothetical protein VNW26_10000 [Steroidobacteraceae bacterium]|nr:hypothetical protein [Steroidobacteraceae bacterium]